MNERQSLAYVSTMADALGLPMDADRVRRVAAHLERTSAMADLLHSARLEPHDEPAEVFCPAPFPAVGEDAP